MKILILKDKQKTEVPLSDLEFSILSTMFALPKKEWPDKVKIGNNFYDKFTLGDLRDYEDNEDGAKTDYVAKEYYDNRRKFLKLSMEDKVKDMRPFFDNVMLYLTTEKPDLDKEYEEFATQWFTEHPTRSTLSVTEILNKFGHLKEQATGDGWYKDFNILMRKKMFDYMILAEKKDMEAEANDIEFHKKINSQYEKVN